MATHRRWVRNIQYLQHTCTLHIIWDNNNNNCIFNWCRLRWTEVGVAVGAELTRYTPILSTWSSIALKWEAIVNLYWYCGKRRFGVVDREGGKEWTRERQMADGAQCISLSLSLSLVLYASCLCITVSVCLWLFFVCLELYSACTYMCMCSTCMCTYYVCVLAICVCVCVLVNDLLIIALF